MLLRSNFFIQSATVCYSDNLIPLGVTFILLAMVHTILSSTSTLSPAAFVVFRWHLEGFRLKTFTFGCICFLLHLLHCKTRNALSANPHNREHLARQGSLIRKVIIEERDLLVSSCESYADRLCYFLRCVFVLLGCLSFHQPHGLCLSCLSSSLFLFLRPCLIHARMPGWGRAFVHGHTFLHSWSGPMTVVVGLLHGATLLSNIPLVLFVSFIGP